MNHPQSLRPDGEMIGMRLMFQALLLSLPPQQLAAVRTGVHTALLREQTRHNFSEECMELLFAFFDAVFPTPRK